MKHEILMLGKTKDSFITKGIEEFEKRLRRYTSIVLKNIKNKSFSGSEEAIRESEGDLLVKNIPQGKYCVCLDSKGCHYTSRGFAQHITDWEKRNIRDVVYVIGGPYGLSKKVISRSDELLSLSKMTFTHDMIRLFLLEQLYRAYTIKAGEKYHK